MDANIRCPRCHGEFSCGAESAMEAPCPCFAVRLSDEARAALRARYTCCVCVPCLKAVQAEFEAGVDPITPPAPPPVT